MTRRLVLLAVEEGHDIEIDWEGDFAYWELIAILRKATEMLEEFEFEDIHGKSAEEE